MNRAKNSYKRNTQKNSKRKSKLDLSNSSDLTKQIFISATFTATPILPGLEFWRKELEMAYTPKILNYNQVFQELLNPESQFLSNDNGLNVILLRFEDWLPYMGEKTSDFAQLISESDDFQQLKRDLSIKCDDFINALRTFQEKAPCQTLLIICPSSTEYQHQEHWNLCFTKLNNLIKEKTKDFSLLHILMAQDFHAQYQVASYDDVLRNQIGHIPFINEYYDFLSTLLIRYYHWMISESYKVIVLDCDNTLWKGVCGEVNSQELEIEGMIKEFQEFLVQQKKQGMLLCLCSKNTEEDVWNVFKNRTDFPLKREDFTDFRINWQSKSENLHSLAKSLNLGLNSFIFIDDNPVECAEVQANCREVFTLQWPESEAGKRALIDHTWAFDHFSFTSEDAKRTVMMQQNIKRQSLLNESLDFNEFLQKLNLTIEIIPITSKNLARVAQLTKRTNQFNFTTIRRSETQIKNMVNEEEFEFRIVHVKDRFGDYGLVGVVIFSADDIELRIDSFMLSCRVLGRGVEYRIMTELGKIALGRGMSRVTALFTETEKNKPAQDFLENIVKQIPVETEINHSEIKKEYLFDAASLSKICYQPGSSSSEDSSNLKTEGSIEKNSLSKSTVHLQPLTAKIKKNMELLTSINLISQAIKGATTFVPVTEEDSTGLSDNSFEEQYEKVLKDVKKIFGKILFINIENINIREPLENYVNDSLRIVELTAQLQRRFQKVTPTFLFENSSIEEIARKIASLNSVSSVFEDNKTVFKANSQEKKSALQSNEPFEVAIIGMNGKFPQADNTEQFWENLLNAASCITEIPKTRWDVNRYFDPEGKSPNKSYGKLGGFIQDMDCFDAAFFNISPKEAEWMDPQQRIFLEVVWGLLEDACYTRETLAWDTGVFVGVMANDYNTYLDEASLQGLGSFRCTDTYQIPNRISYFMNLHGPSIAVNTACSASGTAIHLACESLKRGECSYAIVGGVNLLLHPSRFIQYSQMQILSKNDKCCPFGAEASGTLFGEGSVALLLKPLHQAKQDQDNIYAVIKGTSINSGGKTNGFTVPNPDSQRDLVAKALENSQVSARTISYIEAHGTGTTLGDPIEAQGLIKAFNQDYFSAEHQSDTQYCALGSVKSNIGHLESGAAIAGIMKTVLQMKNKVLVPSLNSTELNPLIPFTTSPFYVTQEVMSWNKPVLRDDSGVEQTFPRRAGVSSFGAGGSNSHVILEEFTDSKLSQNNQEGCIPIIVLSAKNENTLKQMANNLVEFIEKNNNQEELLACIAYNLQTGREHFKCRLAVICDSKADLQQKLKDYLNGESDSETVFDGTVQSMFSQQLRFNTKVDNTFLFDLCQAKDYQKIAAFWVLGVNINWSLYYQEKRFKRISLPTYPFAKERYWLPVFEAEKNEVENATSSIIHPLLHQNTSDFSMQKFSSTFTGKEFFLADHRVNGKPVLPAAAHLEMVRAAVKEATRAQVEAQVGIRLKNVIWVQALTVEEKSIPVHIGLSLKDNDEIGYEIYSELGNDEEPVIYSQGSAVLISKPEIPLLNLEVLQAECNQGVISSMEIYDAFKTVGMEYGSRQQGLEKIYVGKDQLLAKIDLPDIYINGKNHYGIHPSIMDSALQAVIGLMGSISDLKLFVPFSMDEMTIFNDCCSNMWASIRIVEGNKAEDRLHKFNIDLCDDSGIICVQLKGYTAIAPQGEAKLQMGSSKNVAAMMLYTDWKDQLPVKGGKIPEYDQHLVVLCEMDDISKESIETKINGVRCLTLQSEEKNIAKRFETYVCRAFEEIQSIFKNNFTHKVLIQILISNQGEQQLFSGFTGFLKTIRLENPKVISQLIEVESVRDDHEVITRLKENSYCTDDIHIRYSDNKRLVAKWSELEILNEDNSNKTLDLPWKENGIYLITGGAGGLGSLLVKEIANQAKNVTLILTGRSVLTEEKLNQFQKIEETGIKIIYQQTDITNRKAVKGLFKSIRKDYGGLQGIIHCAGIIRDNYIVNKSMEELQEVIAPKICGLVNLDEASKKLNLDFMILFSSITGSLGNAGQIDYATANAFMDSYAKYRNELVALNQRHGKTLSINWPLWKEGGMQIDESVKKLNMESIGIVPMQTQTGIMTLYRGLTSKKNQVMVLEGNLQQIQEIFLHKQKSNEKSSTKAPRKRSGSRKGRRSEMKGLTMAQCVEWDLKRFINRLLKIPRDKIDCEENFANLGFNSISLTQFAVSLIKHYGIEITPALFFSYSTLTQLVQYFLKEHYNEIQEFYKEDGTNLAEATEVEKETQASIPLVSTKKPSIRGRFKVAPATSSSNGLEPVAIIGMSGRFPGARSIEELWDILEKGQNMIREIPEDRFDWRDYYGDPFHESGKTNCKWFGCMPGIKEFEPLFFEISPREAELMDPRQRILLQESWKALEDAGFGQKQIENQKIGMFVGVEQGDYQVLAKGYGDVTSNSNSVLASRLAYFLNLHGPVMAIDTACSSGLVAAYQAILSIRAGECDAAIAGAANLLLTPIPFITMAQAGMLSDDGTCYAFDRRANGMVPGEAAAAVVFKRLSQAEADGDPIYAVIRGSGINYDGKTNGIAAPNGSSQTNLMKSVYDQYKINPEEIDYIVTHGTATRLGDPIEINALYDAFKGYTKKQEYCALTSTKSNFGHCQAAAGLVSLISLVQSLRYETIPASLNCEQENDYINWKESPFYVNKESRPWSSCDGKTRTGAVSAFGMSGTNVHLVLQNHDESSEKASENNIYPCYLLPFSAKTEEALQEKIKDMMEVLQKEDCGYNLAEISYTLMEGRQHFGYRLAVVVQDLEHAIYVLKQAAGKEKSYNLFKGKVVRDFTSQKVIEQYITDLLQQSSTLKQETEKYKEMLLALADFYCQGYDMNWRQLFGEIEPKRAHLPTYPFARECYWLPEEEMQGDNAMDMVITSEVHPLLHQNTSNLEEQRFSSTFSSGEPFIADHTINNQCVFPELVYMEMARAAVAEATSTLEDNSTSVRLENIIWGQPLSIGEQPIQVHIRLYPDDDGMILYEIYVDNEINNESVIYNQGKAVLSQVKKIPDLNIKEIQAQCSHSHTKEELYEGFKSVGRDYGQSHQAVEQVFVGQGQVLAKLSLPSVDSDIQKGYVLHPSIMSAVLQSTIELLRNEGNENLYQPLTLQKLEVSGICKSSMWVWICANNSGATVNYDIVISDETGVGCIRLKGMKIQEDQPAVLKETEIKKDPIDVSALNNSGTASKASRKARKRRPEMKGLSIAECLEWDLKKLVNRLLKIPRDKIDCEENFANYGFNSINLTQFAILLIKHYRVEITPALFFSYSTLGQLAEYYLKEHYNDIQEYYGEDIVETKELDLEDVASKASKKVLLSKKSTSRKRFKETATTSSVLEPVAIIGMSGRFPGARNIEELWGILEKGQNMVREIPSDRFDWREYFGDPVREPGKTNGKWLGYIPGIREFEPLFFEISPREAEKMDPRQRLLLQESWKALEDAGYGPRQINTQKIGMFVGVEQGDYQMLDEGYGDVTSSSNSILASRLAYFLNLNGPVMSIDTACSSSLVAAYQAILSIRAGECDVAIAGGASVLVTPYQFVIMGQAGMLSDNGTCYAFDRRANGMVPGEAVAAVVFKRLSQAEADGDPIYAVIRGSGINYDGKTNGIAAPSGAAQSKLLKTVYDQYKINPEEIDYIVTHGTGTRLGDPIEINALYDAFKGYTKKQGYCALTSTKSNFGHCLTASGLVNLISLVQAIRYETIPASLNCEQESDYINWKQSPFYVNKENKSWSNCDGKMRTAAVSAFGMSGTNVHMVLQSYEGDREKAYKHNDVPCYLLLFSAKTKESLQEKIKDIMEVLQNKDNDCNLAEISYTLMEGRYHFSHRVAVIVQDIDHAIYALKQAFGKEKLPNLFQGKVSRNFKSQKVIEQYIQELIQQGFTLKKDREKYQGMLSALADFYCQGYVMDWKQLFGETAPQRLHLPTYPFVRECYWLPEEETQQGDTQNTVIASVVHPLLHQNTSNLAEQRFSSTFSGKEPFIADHVISNQRVFLGEAFLEMARAAVAEATETLVEDSVGLYLKNIVWGQPLTVGEQPIKVHTRLYQEDNEMIAYEIYGDNKIEDDQPIIYNQGYAVLSQVEKIPNLDINVIQTQCGNSYKKVELYERFKSMGIDYAPSYQIIEQMYVGQGQVLCKLSLPSVDSDIQQGYVLHPAIIGGVLQSLIELLKNEGNPKSYQLLALQEFKVSGTCTSNMWAWISSNNSSSTSNYDIIISDETGVGCIHLKGMEIQEINTSAFIEERSHMEVAANLEEPFELMTFEENWQEQALTVKSSGKIRTMVCFLSDLKNQQTIEETVLSLDPQTKVIFVGQSSDVEKQSSEKYQICRTERATYEKVFESIREEYNEVDAILYLWALEDSSCIEDYSIIVYLLQSMAAAKLKAKRVLLGAQFENELEQSYLESWIGFERSLKLVLPSTQLAAIYQAVDSQTDGTDVMKDWMQKLWRELQTSKVKSVLYQNEKRYQYQIQSTNLISGKSPVKPGGTYLITGGCGGLGFLFAEHLAKKHSVQLILNGRSSLDAKKQSRIKALEEMGSKVMYLQGDVSDITAMREGIRQAKECFGSINGVIHSAGVPEAGSILEKDYDDFQKVLDAKIKGTLVLDELLQEEALDFVCYFSSTAAIIGDLGSCDYAVANRFLMAYAHNRQAKQKGETFVINWPVWRDGGMGFDDAANLKMYFKSSGQRFIETDEAMETFDWITGSSRTQHIVFTGQPSRVHRFLGLNADEKTEDPIISNITREEHNKVCGRRPDMKGLSLAQCIEWDLKELIYQLLKMPRDKIEKDANLADFGFDSISLVQFATLLTDHYKIEITPVLFFENSTVEELIKYFENEHQETIEEFYKEEAMETEVQIIPEKVMKASNTSKYKNLKSTRFITPNSVSDVAEPIAIIGMSGRFPGSQNIDELWEVLAKGENMVREIPVERFDWREFYNDPVRREPGKMTSKWCGSIDGVDEFDPLFFEISPREAENMDPRQRLLLQESWKALEDAGYGPKQIKSRKIGMFVGVEQGDYQLLTKGKGGITSNSNAILAARLAYFLNLNGPVFAMDTACSSGLVAAHQAILSLRSGECDTAIAGGINLLLTPGPYIGMSQAGMLSEEGKCYAFDKRANGLVPGEAVAAVVFKRLSQAQADGDPIYAVIKGSSINYDGKTNGITAPSSASQTNLLKTVYDKYQINPTEIDYIVTHGTGTKLGDPIEINALYDAFKAYTKKQEYCALTSTKTNFGHTFAASGLVSLISLVQALRNETIPASLNCEEENDYIQWKESPFYVNKANLPWPKRDDRARTGALSAFGMSGTNAHMVVQDYTQDQGDCSRVAVPYYLLAFSAKTQKALQEKIKEIIDKLQNESIEEHELLQVSYTLLEGRHHFNYRLAVVVQDCENAINVLKQYQSKERIPNLFQGKVSRDFISQKAIEKYINDMLEESKMIQQDKGKYQEMLFALAELYCQGYEPDWQQLFNDYKLKRIHLPTYPFARDRYWISDDDKESYTLSERQANTQSIQLDDASYNQIIDDLINGTISTDTAVRKTKKLMTK